MGIKNLKKNLISVDKYLNFNDFNNDENNKKKIKNYVCHIDFSILLYKTLLTSENMLDVLNKIKNFFIKIKEKNLLIIYIDPDENIKKKKLQETRDKEKKKFSNKLSIEINKQISELKLHNLNINDSYNKILNQNKIENDYDSYIEKIDIINQKNIIEEKITEDFNEDISSENFLSNLLNFDLLENITEIEELDIDSKQIEEIKNLKIEKTQENKKLQELKEFLYDEDDDDDVHTVFNKTHNIKEIVLPLIDKKKIFSYFITNCKTNFHRNYILNKLLEENIIHIDEIIYTKYIDAEIKIIKIIKKYFLEYENLIFSIDQDIILFSLLHINKKVITIKENYDMYNESIIYVPNSNLSKNISILTFIFNKSDYFPGIKQFKLNETKLIKTFKNNKDSKSLLKKNFTDIKVLCATFLQFFKVKPEIYNKNITRKYINQYFDDIELYFSMHKKFYLVPNTINHIIDIKILVYYLKNENIQKMCKEKKKYFYINF